MASDIEFVAPSDVSLPVRLRRSFEWQRRRASARSRALPDFVVIGAQRAGTTSLFRALGDQDHVIPSFRKEVHFFDLHYRRGIDWYRANFPLRRQIDDACVTGEATPNYLAHPLVPDRLEATIPDAKLIVLLRDPVERTHSSWRLRVHQGKEERGFREAIRQEADSGIDPEVLAIGDDGRPAEALEYAYLHKSRYVEFLVDWYERFPRDQLLVLRSETLFEEGDKTIAAIMDFLGVECGPPPDLPRVNAANASEIDAGDRRWLADYFAPHNSRLEELTGQSFDWT